MKILSIDKARCPQSHLCPSVGACPVKALAQESYFAPTVNAEKCIACGKCIKVCPKKVFSLFEK